jgi:hypothetical protein
MWNKEIGSVVKEYIPRGCANVGENEQNGDVIPGGWSIIVVSGDVKTKDL